MTNGYNNGAAYGSAYMEINNTIVPIEELMEIYPDLRDLVDKYTAWEILKRSPSGKDTLEDLI